MHIIERKHKIAKIEVATKIDNPTVYEMMNGIWRHRIHMDLDTASGALRVMTAHGWEELGEWRKGERLEKQSNEVISAIASYV